MNAQIKRQAELCIEQLGQGTLTEEGLRRIIELAEAGPKTQDLLYLQASTASLTAEVVGMRILQDGEVSDGPANPDDWPYQTLLYQLQLLYLQFVFDLPKIERILLLL